MKPNSKILGTFLAVVIVVAVALFLWNPQQSGPDAEPEPLRIGWQIAWATQGQLALTLRDTNTLDLFGISAVFKPFNYGSPMVEAALAGELDICFVGDQPAVSLLSRSDDWLLAARLMDFRVAVLVTPDSPIRDIQALSSKTLGIPFGASTHRVALRMLQRTGIHPQQDLRIVNLDILEQSEAIKAGGRDRWGQFDAFASWDHHIAQFERDGKARVLQAGPALGVVMVSKDLASTNPEGLARFRDAFVLAYDFYRRNRSLVDAWFAEETGGRFDTALLHAVADIEPNLGVASLAEVDVALNDADLATLQEAADFASAQNLIRRPVVVQERLSMGADEAGGPRVDPRLPDKITVRR